MAISKNQKNLGKTLRGMQKQEPILSEEGRMNNHSVSEERQNNQEPLRKDKRA